MLQEERVYGRVEACGSGLLRHGLNFSTAWCTVQLISIEKDGKHVITQKAVTLNTCCDIPVASNLQSDEKVLHFTF